MQTTVGDATKVNKKSYIKRNNKMNRIHTIRYFRASVSLTEKGADNGNTV